MSKRVFPIVLTGALLAMAQALPSQNASKPTAEVTSAQVSRSVSLRISVFSPEKDLLVPYCGEGEGGGESLCNLSIHVEVETREGWRPMKPRFREVVLGGVPPDKWKFRLIPAGRRHDFYFVFTEDDFAVERGQRLRVVVDTWSDEQSMRTRQKPTQLASPAFDCP